ncbi:MAG: head-tail connector protein [Acidaminococcales bacterium]|jgi:hypothetical protein|nr:head-tail connector protein [Acidaminococcales bacterium]
MSIEELKALLHIDGDDLNAPLELYKQAAERYLLNAGVAADYENALYKTAVSVICGLLIENPLLISGANIGEISSLPLNAIIAQLRLSQAVIS